MKKTLIALLALSSVATADVTVYDNVIFTNGRTSSLTSTRGNLIIGEAPLTLDSWMLEFTITKQADKGTFFSTSRNYNTERGGLGIRTNTPSGLSITTNANEGYASGKLTITDVTQITPETPVTLRMAYDAVSNTAYLYNVGTETYVTASNLDPDEEFHFQTVESTVTGVGDVDKATMFWTDGASAAYTIASVTDMSTLAGTANFLEYVKTKTPPVPEPATGSLSLLALAGLCARRRKK